MSEFDVKEFVRDRDEAFLSLDRQKIEAYMEKYGIENYQVDDLTFWAGVHKGILAIRSATPEQRQRSNEWLRAHGFSAEW